MELTAEDKAGMSPAEIEALTGADSTAHLATIGDNVPEAGAATTATPAADGTPAAGTEEGAAPADGTAAAAETAVEGATPNADGTMPTLEELAALLEDEPTAQAPAVPTPYRVEDKDFKAERTTLRTQLSDIDDKWSAGEMTDAERKAAIAPLQDQLDDLLIAQTRSETLRTANEQSTESQINAACTSIMKAAKAAGTINYQTDKKAAVQFDQMMNMLATDPDNAGKSAAEIANAAHASILALRGISGGKAATPAPPAAPAAPARRDAPGVTLAGVPAASPVGMENDALDKFSQLEGDDAEDYLASLPKAEQDRILRAADVGAMQHKADGRSKHLRDRAA